MFHFLASKCFGWHLGWSSRTQFEETWATLLGVLVTQPITMDQEEETQQEVSAHGHKYFSYPKACCSLVTLMQNFSHIRTCIYTFTVACLNERRAIVYFNTVEIHLLFHNT